MPDVDDSLQLMAAVYPNTFEAKARMNDLVKLSGHEEIELVDGAVMVRHYSGRLEITDRAALTPRAGAKRGALIGGVIGVVFPPSLLASTALGAAAGAVAGGARDHALADSVLESLGEQLSEGRSAILVVVDQEWIDRVETAIDGYEHLISQPLDATTLQVPETE